MTTIGLIGALAYILADRTLAFFGWGLTVFFT